jgi:cytochrome c oxidase cbb3-type subunit 3
MKRVILLLLIALASRAEDGMTRGRAVVERQCVTCHAVAAGDLQATVLRDGPPLVHAGNKFRAEWLVTWLQAPERIRPAGYLPFRYTVPSSDGDRVAMQLLPTHPALSKRDSEDVTAYLTKQRHDAEPAPHASAPEMRGQVHFEKILGCASCHSLGGENGGVSAPELATATRRLDEEWMRQFAFDPTRWSPATMPKLAMRAEQLSAVVDFIQHSGARASSPPTPSVRAGSPPPKTSSAIPTRRAPMLYQLYCSQCHGVRGNGKGINAPSLFVAPRDHTSSEEMGMLTDDRIFAAVKYGGTAVGKSALMPSWNGTIADDDIRLLVGYVRELSGAAP